MKLFSETSAANKRILGHRSGLGHHGEALRQGEEGERERYIMRGREGTSRYDGTNPPPHRLTLPVCYPKTFSAFSPSSDSDNGEGKTQTWGWELKAMGWEQWGPTLVKPTQ